MAIAEVTRQSGNQSSLPGVHLERHFTKDGVHPYDEVKWETTDAVINGQNGPVFEQTGVEFPSHWSEQARNIVASKYFRGILGQLARESSLKQVIDRVVDTITNHGRLTGFFESETSAQIFSDELKSGIINQRFSWNSPVWFNIGVPGIPQQASACFILKVTDNMHSILKWFRDEGVIFKGGSGAGINISTLRSSVETLSGGGRASGPVSFMRAADSVAGSIKSGGTTRRAAKMVILNADHPDIVAFVETKQYANQLAWKLPEIGYPVHELDSPIWDHIQFQNANNSVRATDEFMRSVEADGDWDLKFVSDPTHIYQTVKARWLFDQIVAAAWDCADPGMQFDTTINDWHTLADTSRINGSNPCSEYMSSDDSACNLASLNLLRFARPNRGFDIAGYSYTCLVVGMSQELLVGHSDYPTPEITRNAKAQRQLGQGYANLGALLQYHGYAYDSDEGRDYAAALTAIMTGQVYKASVIAARDATGPYDDYPSNKSSHDRVMVMHRDAAYQIPTERIPTDLVKSAQQVWDEVIEIGVTQGHGFRNAQATVLAPTGTISFMMDCDTTGVEPDFALLRTKKMVGGGVFQMVNGTVPAALENLGYTKTQVTSMTSYLKEHGNLETCPDLRAEHQSVFDCATTLKGGNRSIAPLGHIKMMAAVQPFISGAISKTVNLPTTATPEDVRQVYFESWKLGIKAIAIYRDGCKPNQPMSTDNKSLERGTASKPERRHLPKRRESVTFKGEITDGLERVHKFYFPVGKFEDGQPGEIFWLSDKESEVILGHLGLEGKLTSRLLQYGADLKEVIEDLVGTKFEPSGFTDDPRIPKATSPADFLGKLLALEFFPEEHVWHTKLGLRTEQTKKLLAAHLDREEARSNGHQTQSHTELDQIEVRTRLHAPCISCGSTDSIFKRTGSCETCDNCGTAQAGC